MSDTFSDDYQTVAERIKIFREKYPEGSLRPADINQPFRVLTVGDRMYVAVTSAAYRHPEDKAPGIGQAWEPVPGQNEYSRDSELMISETSSWGRAIIAVLAADSRKVATRDEVTAAQQRRAAGPPVTKQYVDAKAQQPVVEQPRQAAAAPVAQTPPVAPPVGATIDEALGRFREGQPAQPAPAPQPVAAPAAQAPPIDTELQQLKAQLAAPSAQPARPLQQQGITPQQAPESHDPAADADNLSFVDSIMLHIIKNPASTKDELREAWLALSQANMSHWRVEPFGGMEPDGDGKVAITELLSYVAATKN